MGKLKYICGTMGAGKTARAISSMEALEAAGYEVWVVKPAADTRSEPGKLSSRTGAMVNAITLNHDIDPYSLFLRVLRRRRNALIVDEAQFLLPFQVTGLRRLADECDTPILCFGLRTDFRGSLFPAAQRLLELADDVEVIHLACECGRDAVINARVSADGTVDTEGSIYEPGDIGRYVPMCHACYEAARTRETVSEAV